MALVAKARMYDKPPSPQEIEESVKALQSFSDEQKLNDSYFYVVCKAVYCASHETEIEVNGTIYFWNLKKGLSVTENNDMRLWI